MPAQRSVPDALLASVHRDLRQRVAQRFWRNLVDEASAFIAGAADRERHMGWQYLHRAGYIALWNETDYGRKRNHTSCLTPD